MELSKRVYEIKDFPLYKSGVSQYFSRVYLFKFESGYIKIGATIHFESRIRRLINLRGTGVVVYYSDYIPAYLEGWFHAHFNKKKKGGRDCFDLNDDDISFVVNTCNNNLTFYSAKPII